MKKESVETVLAYFETSLDWQNRSARNELLQAVKELLLEPDADAVITILRIEAIFEAGIAEEVDNVLARPSTALPPDLHEFAMKVAKLNAEERKQRRDVHRRDARANLSSFLEAAKNGN